MSNQREWGQPMDMIWIEWMHALLGCVICMPPTQKTKIWSLLSLDNEINLPKKHGVIMRGQIGIESFKVSELGVEQSAPVMRYR